MPESDLPLLLEAGKRAGEIALSFYKKDPQVWDKKGQGPVSEADLAVNDMLRDFLCGARPDYGWLSEETADSGNRLGTRRQFIIDPIDGTRAFLAGSGDWSHSLAVVEEGQTMAAVVALPARDLTYSAGRGTGAMRNGQPIGAAVTASLPSAQVLTTKPNLNPANWRDGAPPDFKKGYRSSLAYRLCLAADGQFDAMMSLRKTWEWDVAAGVLLIEEAGGVATDRIGDPVRFNNPVPQINGVVAGGATVQAALRAHLA